MTGKLKSANSDTLSSNEEPCGCGGNCNKTVTASASHLLCFSCQCPSLSSCLGITASVHSFLLKSPNFLYVCNACKCEAVPASAELKQLKSTVDRIAEIICPPSVPEGEDEFEDGSGSEATGSWTVVRKKKSQKGSYAQVTAKQPLLCKAVAETVSLAIKDRDRDELQKRTVVVENCVVNKDIDDMSLAIDLCAQIHANITVLGVHRMRPASLASSPKKEASLPLGQQQTAKASKVRPPILKILLHSPSDKGLALRYKSSLQDGPEWMQHSFMCPSLPLEERQKRVLLSEVVNGRNGPEPEKENRCLVWLNLTTEKYELRQVKDGKWVHGSEVKKPTEAELAAAATAIQKKQANRQKSYSDSKPVPKNG